MLHLLLAGNRSFHFLLWVSKFDTHTWFLATIRLTLVSNFHCKLYTLFVNTCHHYTRFKEKPTLKKYRTWFFGAFNVLLSHWHELPQKINQPAMNKTIHNVLSLLRQSSWCPAWIIIITIVCYSKTLSSSPNHRCF